MTIRLAAMAATLTLATASALAQSVFAVDLRNDRFVSFDVSDANNQTVLASSYGTSYFAMDFSADGSTLYAIDNTGLTLDVISTADGSVQSSVALSGINTGTITGLTIAPDGTAYLSQGDTARTLYNLDLGTGVASTIGSMGTDTFIDIAADSNGRLWATDIGTDSLWSVDTTTGAATSVGALGFNINFAQGMDFDFSTNTLYALLYVGSGVVHYTSIDLATGAATTVSPVVSGEYEMAINSPVPEPATMTILGLGALAAFRKRKAR